MFTIVTLTQYNFKTVFLYTLITENKIHILISHCAYSTGCLSVVANYIISTIYKKQTKKIIIHLIMIIVWNN